MNFKITMVKPDNIIFNVLITTFALFLTFCGKIDKNKFKDPYDDITQIKGSMNIGLEGNKLSDQFQHLSINLVRIDTSSLNDTEKELYYYYTIYLKLYLDSQLIKEVVTEVTPPNFPSNLIFLRRGPILTKKDIDLGMHSTIKYDQVCLDRKSVV